MLHGAKYFHLSFIVIISFIISLTLVTTAQAGLTISGSSQMSTNGTQTLTASGGSSGHHLLWLIHTRV